MTTFVHVDPDDDPFDSLELQGIERRPEYEGTDGWTLTLHVPNDPVLFRAVIDRWAPR